jgi:Domain of unknown function (DUF1835)
MARKLASTEAPQFAFSDAVHLIRGDSPAGSVRQAGARFIVPVLDMLAYGPASFDPAQHRHVRRAFWNEVSEPNTSEPDYAPIAADELDAAVRAFPSGLPLVFWSGENWGDRLFLWWAKSPVR